MISVIPVKWLIFYIPMCLLYTDGCYSGEMIDILHSQVLIVYWRLSVVIPEKWLTFYIPRCLLYTNDCYPGEMIDLLHFQVRIVYWWLLSRRNCWYFTSPGAYCILTVVIPVKWLIFYIPMCLLYTDGCYPGEMIDILHSQVLILYWWLLSRWNDWYFTFPCAYCILTVVIPVKLLIVYFLRRLLHTDGCYPGEMIDLLHF